MMDHINNLRKCLFMKKPLKYGGTYYKVESKDDTLFLYFGGACDDVTWLRCFDFRARTHLSLHSRYKVHGGFVDAFKNFVGIFEDYILAKDRECYRYKRIYMYGYSYGGALAMLLHEYAFSLRPDAKVRTYAIEVPKIFSKIDRIFHYRFTGLTIINMKHSLVSWLHPFRKNPVVAIKLDNDYKFGLEAHYPDNIYKTVLNAWHGLPFDREDE